jgi:mRNA interferase MazF
VSLVRGRVYLVDLGLDDGPKNMLVVSNDTRNRQLPTILAVRVTTTPKPAMRSIVELPHGEPLVGRVLCDGITVIYEDEVVKDVGAFSPATMRAVEAALIHALGIAR